MIRIRQAVKTVAGRVEIGEPKSRDSRRDVPVPQGLRSMVVRLRNTEDKYIFQSPNREQPFDPKHYRDKFKTYLEALGDVRVLTPHSCRHTYVSQMQALGVDLATIQSMVDQADLDMTQHYLHVQNPVEQKLWRRERRYREHRSSWVRTGVSFLHARFSARKVSHRRPA